VLLLALVEPAPARAAGADRPVIVVVAHNDGTEPTDFLVPFGLLASSGLAEVHAVALAAGPVMLHPTGAMMRVPAHGCARSARMAPP